MAFKSENENATEEKKNGVKLYEKIEIFERFAQTGQKLTGKTIFEGYPIGQWAIQIRNSFKVNKNGDRRYKQVSIEQLEKLEKLGILESQQEAKIDEKIQTMAEWVKKYPKARLLNINNIEDVLREYAFNDNNEYEKLFEEYSKLLRYYDYTRSRKSRGKLTVEQIQKAKDANIGGVLGYSDEVEEMSKKYGFGKADIVYLLNKYGDIKNFYKLYIRNEIKDVDDCNFARSKIIKNAIDVDGSTYSRGYDGLVNDLMKSNSEILIYSSEIINEKLSSLKPKVSSDIVRKRYNLKGDVKNNTLTNIGKEVGLSRERIRQKKETALKKVDSLKNTIMSFCSLKDKLTEIEKKDISYIEDIVCDVCLGLRDYDDEEVKKICKEFKEIIIKNSKNIENDKIEILDLSERSFNCLKENGYDTIDQLMSLNRRQLLKFRKLGKKSADEIMSKIEPYRKQYEQKKKEKEKLEFEKAKQAIINGNISNDEKKLIDKVRNLRTKDLALSVRAYNSLARVRCYTLDDVFKLEKDICNIRGLGNKSYKEIIEKIEPYRVFWKQEQSDTKNEAKEVVIEAKSKMSLNEQEEKQNSDDLVKEEEKACQKGEENIKPENSELEEIEDKPLKDVEKYNTDLIEIREKRNELQEKVNQLKSRLNQAQILLDECKIVLGEDEKDKKPKLDD